MCASRENDGAERLEVRAEQDLEGFLIAGADPLEPLEPPTVAGRRVGRLV
jgi:hypothetical protein